MGLIGASVEALDAAIDFFSMLLLDFVKHNLKGVLNCKS